MGGGGGATAMAAGVGVCAIEDHVVETVLTRPDPTFVGVPVWISPLCERGGICIGGWYGYRVRPIYIKKSR